MGLRVRKSIKLGKGVRLNLNKKSVGLSVGGKAGRVSVNNKGRRTTTLHTPIKGVSYVKTHSAKSSNGSSTTEHSKKKMKTGYSMLFVTIFLGVFGVHRFASGQIGMGLFYLFTAGGFVIGWICDIIYQIKHLNDAVTV